jgi:hypothetical protein
MAFLPKSRAMAGDIPAAETCMSYGFDSGDVGCTGCAIDTASCGTCGNGIKDGAEACDGVDLGGDSCMSLFASTGTLGCEADCSYDVTGCDLAPVVYDISAPNTSSTQTSYFRGHGYNADSDGQLLDFEVYLGLGAAVDHEHGGGLAAGNRRGEQAL